MVVIEPEEPAGVQTAVYSSIGGHEVLFDYWLPSTPAAPAKLPVVIYFHGGGAFARNRKTERTMWADLQARCMKEGYVFVSADYRLIVPCTAFDIIEDVKALFVYLVAPDGFAKLLPTDRTVDGRRIAVAGCSGGGYVSRLACVHARPRPAAHINFFGIGGDMLNDHLLLPRKGSFAVNDPATEAKVDKLLEKPGVIVSNDDEEPFPNTRAMLVGRLSSNGTWLDHYWGSPGISEKLAAVPYEKRLSIFPEHLRPVLPEIHIDTSYPATFHLHGSEDLLVLPDESRADYAKQMQAGVRAELVMVPGAHHMLINEWPPTELTELVPSTAEVLRQAADFIISCFQAVGDGV